MPTIVWILIWVAVLGVIAFLAVREIRSGRKQPAEFDRMKHEAVRDSEMNRQSHGPNSAGAFFGGGS
jgi:hypothetical protein